MRRRAWLLLAALVAACASEEFDAPLDQNGDAPANLCAGATDGHAAGCVLYDGFTGELERWKLTNPTPDDAVVKRLAVADDGRKGLLQIGDCPGKAKPAAETELRLDRAGDFTIRAEWRSVDKDAAVLRMTLDGADLLFPTAATNSPPAWMATTIAATAQSKRPILKLEAESLSETLCANVWVDWVAVQQ